MLNGTCQQCHSIQPLCGAHGGLDVQRTHILPVLLQQRHEKVDSQVDICRELIWLHVHMTNSNSQTQNLQAKHNCRAVVSTSLVVAFDIFQASHDSLVIELPR